MVQYSLRNWCRAIHGAIHQLQSAWCNLCGAKYVCNLGGAIDVAQSMLCKRSTWNYQFNCSRSHHTKPTRNLVAAAPARARTRAQRSANLARPTRPRWRCPKGTYQPALQCGSVNWAGAVSWQRRQR
eukprot:5205122-Pyramimonas_sp.AAC.1